MTDELAVIGSGPSGLAAAFRLQQRGYGVTLFERDDIPGGKMRTVHRDGYQIEEGPLVISRSYVNILTIAREAGLGDEILEASAVYGFPRDGKIHTFDAGRIIRDGTATRLVSKLSRARLARIAADCFRMRKTLKACDLAALSEHDVESGAEYVMRVLGREALDYIVDPALKGLCSSTPDELSVLDIFYCFNNFLGIPRAYAFRDGMASYGAALAPRFDTRYGAEVVAVEEANDSVRVTWRSAAEDEQTAEFAGCVIAAPADSTHRIHVGLDPWSKSFLEQVRYTPLITATVGLRAQPPTEASFVLTPTVLAPDSIGMILEHNKVPGRAPAGKGLITIGGTADLSRTLWDASDDQCTETLLRSVHRILPIPMSDVELTHVCRWPGVSLISPVGYYRELARFEREQAQRYKRIQLASDYFCTSNINSATAAGERAAAKLAGNLATGGTRVPERAR